MYNFLGAKECKWIALVPSRTVHEARPSRTTTKALQCHFIVRGNEPSCLYGSSVHDLMLNVGDRCENRGLVYPQRDRHYTNKSCTDAEINNDRKIGTGRPQMLSKFRQAVTMLHYIAIVYFLSGDLWNT